MNQQRTRFEKMLNVIAQPLPKAGTKSVSKTPKKTRKAKK